MSHKIVSAWQMVTTGLMVVAATVTTAYGQSSQTISTDDPRPLASIVRNLEKKYGVVITYEDPPYLHSSQIKDVTDAVARSPNPGGRRIYVPRGGPFAFTSTLEPNASQSAMRSVLQRLVNEYNTTGYGGDFRVTQVGDVFHIVPRVFRNRGGVDEPFAPVLDARISIAGPAKRSALEVLEETTAAVTRATGIPVLLGHVPLNLRANSAVAIRADEEAARSVLVRTLAGTGARLSWVLYYSPEQQPRYYLSIHGVSSTKSE